MGLIKLCPGCGRKNRFALGEKPKLCAKCVQEGKKVQEVKLTPKKKS